MPHTIKAQPASNRIPFSEYCKIAILADVLTVQANNITVTPFPKSPSVRGFFASLPVHLLFKYLPNNAFYRVLTLPQCNI